MARIEAEWTALGPKQYTRRLIKSYGGKLAVVTAHKSNNFRVRQRILLSLVRTWPYSMIANILNRIVGLIFYEIYEFHGSILRM